MSGLTRDGTAEPLSRDQADGDREIFISLFRRPSSETVQSTVP